MPTAPPGGRQPVGLDDMVTELGIHVEESRVFFAGGPWSASDWESLAACEGDELVEQGALPSSYGEGNEELGVWGAPVAYEAGYAWVIVGDDEAFDLYVLSSSTQGGALSSPLVTTYCDFVVVTRLRAELVTRSYDCAYGGDYATARSEWRIRGYRQTVALGNLEEVVEVRVETICTLGNVQTRTMGLNEATVQGTASVRSEVSPADGGAIFNLGAEVYGGQVIAGAYAPGCTTNGRQCGVGFQSAVAYARDSNVVAAIDASARYEGPAATNLAHAFHLLHESDRLKALLDQWWIDFCWELPLDCSDGITGFDPGPPGGVSPGSVLGA